MTEPVSSILYRELIYLCCSNSLQIDCYWFVEFGDNCNVFLQSVLVLIANMFWLMAII